MPACLRGKKPAKAHRQVTDGCRGAGKRRQESGQEKKPPNDCKKADNATDECRGARSGEFSESAKTLCDCAQGNRDSQKD